MHSTKDLHTRHFAPPQVFWRMGTAVCYSAIVGIFTARALASYEQQHTAAVLLGIEPRCWTPGSLISPILCVALLFGTSILLALWELSVDIAETGWRAALAPRFALGRATMPALRDLVIAPLTEEWVFRACLISLYNSAGLGPVSAVAASSAAFGLAHVHHYAELRRNGASRSAAATHVAVQAAYTSVFGAAMGAMLQATHAFPGVVLAHSFANWMGLPDAPWTWTPGHRLYKLKSLFSALHGVCLFSFVFGSSRIISECMRAGGLARVHADGCM